MRGVLLACFALLMVAAPGARAQNARVIGGHAAADGNWPFQTQIVAQISSTSGAFCGGTLIAPQWVITAAHCTVDKETGKQFPVESFTLRIGSIRLRDGEVHRARRVITHERFGPGLQNDIALIELDTPSRQPVVRLDGVVLPSQTNRDVETPASPWATVIGWGLTVPGTKEVAVVLQQASLPLVDADQCNRSLSPDLKRYGAIDDRRICAGRSQGGVDSCQGDSGGPLLLPSGSQDWAQIGIVSYGEIVCGSPNSFGVYTRVAAFSDWIARSIGATAAPTSTPTGVLGAPAAAPTVMAEAQAEEERGDLSIAMSRRELKLGESFVLDIRSSFDGHLVLFDLNSKNELTQLFPNPRSEMLHKGGTVRGGAMVRLPDTTYGFEFRASEPRGRGRILAVVVTDPAMLGAIKPGDGFRTLTNPGQILGELERSVQLIPAQSGGVRKWGAAYMDYIVQ